MSTFKEIDFYYDVVCPFAYCASTQIDSLAAKYNVKVNWHPVLLGGVYVSSKAPQGKNSATTVQSPDKRVWSGIDLKWQCERYNITLKFPFGYPTSTIKPMRLLLSIRDNDLRRKCSKLLYKHYWVKNDNLKDENVLLNIVKTIGINDISSIHDESIKQELREKTDEAVERGIFGVPTIFVGKQQYFGIDRLPFVDQQLCYGKLLYPPINRLYKNPSVLRNTNTIEFYFDYTSPWSFLAYCRIKELVPFCKNLIYRPIFLGGIVPRPPIFGMQPIKRKYLGKDLQRYFDVSGIKMKSNTNFPIKTILALRVFILDNKTIDCVFKATWQQNLDIGNKEILCKILDRNGFNGKKLISEASNKTVKDALKTNTNFAKSKGIFGVPTFVVNNDYSRFVWGQDRFDYVKDLCCGWKPVHQIPQKRRKDSKL